MKDLKKVFNAIDEARIALKLLESELNEPVRKTVKSLDDLREQFEALRVAAKKLVMPQSVPFWGVFNFHGVKVIERISKKNELAFGYIYESDNHRYYAADDFLRLATPEEIKNHLVSIAKAKYGDKEIKNLLSCKTGLLGNSYYYSYYLNLLFSNGMLIYRKGVWADLALPTYTKSELVELIGHDFEYNQEDSESV